MGIWERFVSSQFVDIIEWTQNDRSTMVYRFPRYKNEIKYGAKLIVREGQVAILVNGGELADIFQPGTYELDAPNLPVLSTLQNWKHGFESPFKAEVYFFNTTDFLNLKWGTRQAITIRDKEFGMVRLRAYGSYVTQIKQADVFLRKVVGTDGNLQVEEISDQLTSTITTYFSEVLAESNVSALDIATQYSEIAQTLKNKIASEFTHYGLSLEKVFIENINLPENVQKVLDDKTSLNILGDDLAKHTQLQAGKGLAEGGESSGAVGAGVGLALGQQIGQQIGQPHSDNANKDTPPPPPKIYYLMIVGERVGPLSEEQVYEKLLANEIQASTLIWRKGFAEWQAIKDTAEIDLTRLPPPPPTT